MNTPMLVSIVINNYNYARFLGSAIESALAQSYSHIEVIVVDDGSVDASPAVIASYDGRIVPVLQENGGQAAAFNAGLARAKGALVVFLDADDLLHPAVVAQVVAAFEANPRAVRVQYRLAVIDGAGNATGAMLPANAAIPAGDLREAVLDYGDDIAWLPTSGNAFKSATLRQIFPMPTAPYRICADYYLSNLTPLLGEVVALEPVGGYYRVHGGNNHYQVSQLDPERLRQKIVRTVQTHQYIEQVAAMAQDPGGSVGRQTGPDERRVGWLSLTNPASRLVSLRLDRARHPLPEDTRLGLMGRGMVAALRRPQLSRSRRLLSLGWFLLVAVVPGSRAVRMLGETLFYPGVIRQWFQRRAANRRGLRPAQRYGSRVGE